MKLPGRVLLNDNCIRTRSVILLRRSVEQWVCPLFSNSKTAMPPPRRTCLRHNKVIGLPLLTTG